MRKYSIILIGILFLAYGLIRLGVGTVLLGQELGVIDIEAFQEPIQEIGDFLDKKNRISLIPFSVAGYVGIIALMGITLTIGAIRTLKNKPYSLIFIAIFLAIYALLFINFQTINPKIIHLMISFILFVLLNWLKRHPNKELMQ